jgi:septum formation protein
MINNTYPIYLASKSPRRKELLQLVAKNIHVLSVDTPEKVIPGETPIATAKRIAYEKLTAAIPLVPKKSLLITADTIVICQGHILGKPKNPADAKRMLKLLSGKEHYVVTGLCVRNQVTGKEIVTYSKTRLIFRELGKKEIEDYVATGSPLDKAGAYGIQDGYGAVFTQKINGCYYNVMGLPLSKLQESIQRVL